MPAETVARWTEAVDSGLERYGAENTARIAALRRQILGLLNEAGATSAPGTSRSRSKLSPPGAPPANSGHRAISEARHRSPGAGEGPIPSTATPKHRNTATSRTPMT